MAGINVTSDLGDILPKFIAAVKFKLQEQEKARATVTVETLSPGQGSAYNLPLYSALTAFALTEGVDMAQAQAVSDSNLAISPTEVGVQVLITRLALRRNKENVLQNLRKLSTDALVRKKDQDIFDDAANFNTDFGGSATLKTEDLFAAETALAASTSGSAGGPAPEPYFFWVHPNSLFDIISDVEGFGSGIFPQASTPLPDGTSQDVFTGGRMALRRISNLTIVSSTNIAASGSVDASNAALSKGAVILVEETPPEFADEPDVSMRGLEINLVQSYATGEYEDTWGRLVTADATDMA